MTQPVDRSSPVPPDSEPEGRSDWEKAPDWRGHPLLSSAAAAVTALLIFGALLIAGMSVFIVSRFWGVEPSQFLADPGWMLSGAAVQQLTLIALVPVLIRVFHLDVGEILPRRTPSWVELVGTLVLLFGAVPLAMTLAGLAARVAGPSASEAVVRLASTSSLTVFLGYLLVAAVLPGIAEEALFRGVILGFFLPRNRVLGLLVSTFLFAAVHGELVQGVGTFLLGLAFGIARLETRSIWPSMLAHALFNGTVLTVARFSGVESGADAELPSASVVLSGVLLWAGGWWLLAKRRRSPAPG